jgi:hypothetical protein
MALENEIMKMIEYSDAVLTEQQKKSIERLKQRAQIDYEMEVIEELSENISYNELKALKITNVFIDREIIKDYLKRMELERKLNDWKKIKKRIPILTDDEKDLLYGNHIRGGTNELIGQSLSKLLFYGFYLDEIKENWKKYTEHYNHIKNFGEKIQKENGFVEWLSIEDYEEEIEKGNGGKYMDDIIVNNYETTSLEDELNLMETV